MALLPCLHDASAQKDAARFLAASDKRFSRPHDLVLSPVRATNRRQGLDPTLAPVKSIGGRELGFHEPKYFDLNEKGYLSWPTNTATRSKASAPTTACAP